MKMATTRWDLRNEIIKKKNIIAICGRTSSG